MTRQLNIELSDAERAMVEAKAKAAGTSMRELVVRAVAAYEERDIEADRHGELLSALDRIADRVGDVEQAVKNAAPYR